MRPKLQVTISAMLASALALCAQAAIGADLQAAYQAAANRDAPLQAARQAALAASERLAQAEAALRPNVSAAVEANHIQAATNLGGPTGYNHQSGGLRLNLPLYRPGNQAAVAAAKSAEHIARSQLTQIEQGLITRVASAYFDALAADDAVAVAQAQQRAITEQFTSAKRQFEVGTVTVTDQQEAQARLDLNGARLAAARNERVLRLAALQTLTGSDLAPLYPLRRDAALPDNVGQELEAFALRVRDESFAVRQATLATEVARHQLDQARHAGRPTLDFALEAGLSHGTNPLRSNPFVNRARSASAGLQLSVPLYTGGGQEAREREAAAQLSRSQADLEHARQQTHQAARQTYLGMESALEQVGALAAAVRSSQMALQSNLRGYQVGVRLNVDVLNAQQQWFEARRALSRARYDVLTQALALKAIAGNLQPTDIGTLNALLIDPAQQAPDDAVEPAPK